jgi:acyl-coenzyme A synthetase/AMP-(fatty) acid ligase
MIFSSGAPLPAATAAAFREKTGNAPTEVYGSTESGGIAWRHQANDDAAWTPMPRVSISQDADGALSISSPHLFDTSALRIDDGITLLSDGRFLLNGRLDRVVKVEGKRLSLPDMENELRVHPCVIDATLIVLDGRRQVLGAIVQLSDAGRLALDSIGRRALAQVFRHFLAKRFEPVVLPRRWRFPREIPLDDRGKRNAATLAALFAAG